MNKEETKQYLHEGSDYLQSFTKISGKKIKDIVGYLSNEYDEPTFKITEIVFEDGTEQGVEGEHDFPYIVDYDDKTIELMETIYKLENPEEAEQ